MRHRICFFLGILFLALACQVPQNQEKQPLMLKFPEKLTLSGEFARRIALTERRLQTDSPFHLDLIVQDVARNEKLTRRFEEYEGDVSGRILGAWSCMSRLLNQRPAKLDSIAERVLKYQNAEGYFGVNQQPDGWDMWGRQNFGHGRLLLGLVEYYKLSHDQRFLTAAEKLGDYFTRTISEWKTAHVENPWSTNDKIDWNKPNTLRRHFIKTHQTSVLEGIMALYTISKKSQYLEAAKSIVPLFPEFGQYHSHSFLNTLVGMVMLYQNSGDQQYKEFVEKMYWQQLMLHGQRQDGAVVEFYPLDHRTEGCSLTDWLRLNLYLWQITQETHYLDEAERTWLNGLYYHQTANGAFGHAVLNADGYEAHYSEAWWCCLMHGLYAYADIAQMTVVGDRQEVWINFYTPLQCEILINEIPLKIEMKTPYPQQGAVEITMHPEQPMSFSLNLRIPRWVDVWEICLNDEAIDAPVSKGVLKIKQEWRDGDKISLAFPIQLRLEDEAGNYLLEQRQHLDCFYPTYFFHGPLLLGADTRHNAQLPAALFLQKGGNFKYNAQILPGNPFELPGAHYQIPMDLNHSEKAATLVPISELTGYDLWTDEWQNFLRNSEKPIERDAVRIRFPVKIF